MLSNDLAVFMEKWPLIQFKFSLQVDATVFIFQDAAGLIANTSETEYGATNTKPYSTGKIPGMMNRGIVQLKKGICSDREALLRINNEIKMNTISRRIIGISLLDEANEMSVSWRLVNAFPSRITGFNKTLQGDVINIDTMEIAHEGIYINP